MSVCIEVVVTEPFGENTLIVYREGRSDCVLVDPGFQSRSYIERLQELSLTPAAILLTHGHVDHIAGVSAVKRLWPEAPIVIGRQDAPMLGDPQLNLSFLGGASITAPPADCLLDEGDQVDFAGLSCRVLEIPGHSPGHIVYLLKTESPQIVLGGDVLFAGSIGRTDFPGGNHRLLLEGIRGKLFSLPGDTVVYPGHGPTTTIADERTSNPYCGEAGFAE